MRSLWKLFILFLNKKNNRKWILCYGGLGDVCYNMAYSEWILNNIDDSVYYVDKCHKDFLLNFYPIDKNRIEYYDGKSNFGRIIRTIGGSPKIFIMLKKLGIYKLYPYSFYSITEIVPCSYLEFIRCIFEIPKDTNICFPHVIGDTICSHIENFAKFKNKIIVINPYSGSMGSGDWTYWEQVSAVLNSKGYIVYTNVIGNQYPISQTYPLRCSISEMYYISSCIPLTISIRSGIIDFCVSSGGSFYVVYFDEKTLHPKVNASMRILYKLEDWGNSNVHEYYFDDSIKTNIQDFLDYLNMHGL